MRGFIGQATLTAPEKDDENRELVKGLPVCHVGMTHAIGSTVVGRSMVA
jgi:hypothetical protein